MRHSNYTAPVHHGAYTTYTRTPAQPTSPPHQCTSAPTSSTYRTAPTTPRQLHHPHTTATALHCTALVRHGADTPTYSTAPTPHHVHRSTYTAHICHGNCAASRPQHVVANVEQMVFGTIRFCCFYRVCLGLPEKNPSTCPYATASVEALD